MTLPLLLPLLCAGPQSARAERPSQDAAALAQLWVRLPSTEARQQARELGLGFCEGQRGHWWRMDGPPQVQVDLDAAGLDWTAAASLVPPTLTGYHDADDVIAVIDELVVDQPALVQRVDLGWSLDGRALVGIRLSATDLPLTQWRLVGTHHGDEWASSEVALDTAQRLVQAWQDDPEVADFLDHNAVWLIPQINPDGFEAGARYNSAGVDLNRNYDYQWSSTEWRSGERAFSEPETRALRALQSWEPTVAGLSFHAGAANIGWVWNYDPTPTADDDLLISLAQRYDDAATVPGFWLTNGAQWYITHGDTNDWSYGRQGVLDFTVEVSVTKAPDASTLPALKEQHWPGVRAFLLSDGAAAGQVVDRQTGLGLPASITPADGGWPSVSGPAGQFARLLTGPTLVTVEVPGFASTELTLTPGDDLSIGLESASLLSVRPDPPRLAANSSQTFALPVAADTVVLHRLGHDSVSAVRASDGWEVDTTGLEAGPWDLLLDGLVAPRSIFIGEEDGAVSITAHSLVGDSLELIGSGFGQGTQAWALVGDARSAVPLLLSDSDDERLMVDLSPLVDTAYQPDQDVLDVVLLSNARQLVVLDVGGLIDEDDNTGTSSDGGSAYDSGTGTGGDTGGDTGSLVGTGGQDSGSQGSRGCACGTTPHGPFWTLPLLLLLLPLSRRRSMT